ncbi:DUF2750 domain-containing protein [Thermodesulfobacteriota bacterium]
MNESDFFQEILEDGNVWVAMVHDKIFVLGFKDGTSALPVWPNRENAVDFINDGRMDSLGPVEVPLSTFKVAWIAEGAMDFDELAIDPKAKESKHLLLTKEEFFNHIHH